MSGAELSVGTQEAGGQEPADWIYKVIFNAAETWSPGPFSEANFEPRLPKKVSFIHNTDFFFSSN